MGGSTVCPALPVSTENLKSGDSIPFQLIFRWHLTVRKPLIISSKGYPWSNRIFASFPVRAIATNEWCSFTLHKILILWRQHILMCWSFDCPAVDHLSNLTILFLKKLIWKILWVINCSNVPDGIFMLHLQGIITSLTNQHSASQPLEIWFVSEHKNVTCLWKICSGWKKSHKKLPF